MDAFLVKYGLEVIVVSGVATVAFAVNVVLGWFRLKVAKQRAEIARSDAVAAMDRLIHEKERLAFHRECLDRSVLPPGYRATMTDNVWVCDIFGAPAAPTTAAEE